MKYAFFPGCSLESTAWDFDRSTRAVCRALGIELEDIPDWVCCGSTPAHASSASLAVALPVLNLQKAQAAGLPVMTACASCYARLRTANHKVRNDAEERQRAERITGKPYDGSVEVHHVLDVLVNHFGVDAIRARVQPPAERPARGLLLRLPADAPAGDRGLRQRRASALHGRPGGRDGRGAGRLAAQDGMLRGEPFDDATQRRGRLGHRLLSMARQAGAECIAVACPLCQVNLDLRQADAEQGPRHSARNARPLHHAASGPGLGAFGRKNWGSRP